MCLEFTTSIVFFFCDTLNASNYIALLLFLSKIAESCHTSLYITSAIRSLFKKNCIFKFVFFTIPYLPFENKCSPLGSVETIFDLIGLKLGYKEFICKQKHFKIQMIIALIL